MARRFELPCCGAPGGEVHGVTVIRAWTEASVGVRLHMIFRSFMYPELVTKNTYPLSVS